MADSLRVGQVVLSLAGRDKGKYYIVLSVQGSIVSVADGRIKKVERPKKKNIKHLRSLNKFADEIELKISAKMRVSNQDVAKALQQMQSTEIEDKEV